ncbi:starch synthase, partial [bacterium]|nr:starch synthase [bacterium]
GIVVTPDEAGLKEGLERSLKLYKDQTRYKAVQKEGMERDFSWKVSAMDYEDLYKKVLFGESQTHNPWGR